MPAAQYHHTVKDLEVPDLLVQADLIRDAMGSQGWETVQAAIDAHKAKMLQRLLHEAHDQCYIASSLRGEVVVRH